MRKTFVFLCFGILFAYISQAAAPPKLYCEILEETKDLDIEVVDLYLTKDETGKPQVHLEGDISKDRNIPEIMERPRSSSLMTNSCPASKNTDKKTNAQTKTSLFIHLSWYLGLHKSYVRSSES